MKTEDIEQLQALNKRQGELLSELAVSFEVEKYDYYIQKTVYGNSVLVDVKTHTVIDHDKTEQIIRKANRKQLKYTRI